MPDLLVKRCDANIRGPVFPILDVDSPRLAAHLTVLDVLLCRAAAGIDYDLNRLVAVRTIDCSSRLGRAVAEGEFIPPVSPVPCVRTVDHTPKLRVMSGT